jgi:hypothetical protein
MPIAPIRISSARSSAGWRTGSPARVSSCPPPRKTGPARPPARFPGGRGRRMSFFPPMTGRIVCMAALDGLGRQHWKMETEGARAVRLSLQVHSPDGDQGFPGAVDFTVTIAPGWPAVDLCHGGGSGPPNPDQPWPSTAITIWRGRGRIDGSSPVVWRHGSLHTPAGAGSDPDRQRSTRSLGHGLRFPGRPVRSAPEASSTSNMVLDAADRPGG